MIESSVTAWLLLMGIVALSSAAGLLWARRMPWNANAREAGIAAGFGLAVAPFLAGFCVILLLLAFPGASHEAHLSGTVALMTAIALTALLRRGRRPHETGGTHANDEPVSGIWRWLFGALFLVWIVGFLGESVFMPLTESDALEYATVGRLVYELRSLQGYPAMDPSLGHSGFFGPWTHPPLYVALIYLSHLIQGHAEAPGLMRMIAPWFVVTATLLTYALGRRFNRFTGLVAALILLSTPLLYMGANSGLIDALPVAAITLFFCSVVGIESSPIQKGLLQGLIMGMGMWTHSEAILFLPLGITSDFLFSKERKPADALRQYAALGTLAAAIIVGPYLYNLKTFGSLVSDNPAVFAMEKLQWSEYFRMSRAIDSWPSKVMYGIFKGWFAPESFSIGFWLMTFGLVFALRRDRWKLAAAGIVLCYVAGAAASTAIGVDLMIRNGRYLLILSPFVALLAASFLDDLARKRSFLASAAVFLAFAVFCAQFAVIGTHKWRRYGIGASDIADPFEDKLQKWPAYGAVHFLRNETPADALVLTLKPGDLYYSERRMVSYLDPRLLPFYAENEAEAGWKRLSDLGIRYVHVPDRTTPAFYNSTLEGLLARDGLAKLAFSENGYQIYEIVRHDSESKRETWDLSPSASSWILSCRLALGGEKGLLRVDLSSDEADRDAEVTCSSGLPVSRRDVAASLTSPAAALSAVGEHEYRADLAVVGNAYAQAYLLQYDAEGRLLDRTLLGELIVVDNRSPTRLERRFRATAETKTAKIALEYRATGSLRVTQAALESLDEGKE